LLPRGGAGGGLEISVEGRKKLLAKLQKVQRDVTANVNRAVFGLGRYRITRPAAP
jgi:hypothetical protein